MKRFLRSDSFRLLVVIAAVVFAGIIFAAFSHNASSPVTTVAGVVFKPLQKISSAVYAQLGNVSSSFVSSSTYIEENESLKKEIAEYREKLADYDELKKRVDSYEKFYEIKKRNPDYKFSYGTVVSRDAADAYNSFVLNTGINDGVEVDDPVIYGNYVIGIVKKVNYSTCVVRTVLDPRVNIGAYESGTREYGYVSGDDNLFKDGLCRLSGLDTSTSIVKGEMVCTSGSGGVFPNGLIIGEVVSVKNDPATSSYYAEVKPSYAIDEITDVFVITSFEGQGESGLTD